MGLVSITCARNEEDIIEAFVRHTLTFVDRMIVLDHGSTDETAWILRELQEENLPLEVITDARFGHYQAEQMNSLLRLAAHEYGAQWVFCLDADEFLAGVPPREVLPKEHNPPSCKVFTRCYHVNPGDDPGEVNPVLRITHRLQNDSMLRDIQSFYISLVPRHLALDPSVLLAQGSHTLRCGENEPPFVILEDLFAAHFPMRSAAQYAIKLTAKRIQDKFERSPLGVSHSFYDPHYELLKENYSDYSSGFSSLPLAYLPGQMNSMAFVRDPIDYRGEPLRHGRTITADSVIKQNLALLERLGGYCFVPDANALNSALAPVTLKVETLPGPTHTPVFHQPAAGGEEQTFGIPLQLPEGTRTINLTWTAQPGLVEIVKICLAKDAVLFGEDAVSSEDSGLKILAGAIRFDQSLHPFRFLVSRESAVLAVSCPPLESGVMETRLDVTYRFRARLSLSEVLSPGFVRQICEDQKESARQRQEIPTQPEVVHTPAPALPPLPEFLRSIFYDPQNHPVLAEILDPALLAEVLPDRPDPPGIYLRGNLIDFSQGGNFPSIQSKGWTEPQPRGIWNELPVASLVIPMATPLTRPAFLHLFCRSLPNRVPLLNVEVRLNGQVIGCLRLKSRFRRWRWIRLPLPFDHVSPLAHAEFEFFIEPPTDPGLTRNEGPPRFGLRFLKIE